MAKQKKLPFALAQRTGPAAVLSLALWSGLCASATCEDLNVTTYSPSPLGYFDKITTRGQSVLARDQGNVGIGTNNPQSKLVVRSGSNGISLDPTGTPYLGELGFNRNVLDGAIFNKTLPAIQLTAWTNGLDFQMYDKNGAMTSVPLSLGINGNVKVDKDLQLGVFRIADAPGHALMFTAPGVGPNMQIWMDASNGNITTANGGLFARSNEIESMNGNTLYLHPMTRNGVVSNPQIAVPGQTPLPVYANLWIKGSLRVDGGCLAGCGGGSDERLKQIHGPFNASLREVLQLQPIRYHYKKGNSLGLPENLELAGLSAQQVEKVIPEAVVKHEQGYRTLNTDAILGTLLNAIKEQEAKIDSQEAELQSLKAELKALKKAQ